ncbi:MAG TPA: PilZ domain-containing protein [Candidatus Competibacter sp.]|jgi:hypothetical protein|nr:PilZ domain-containing protein [Candidatus Competibacter sp.]HRF62467.1 PilZ domain-containing protein [Candidatus Competibacter sp.]HRX60038.1 PilZ domain-containing protein [Candidatus Competibacter sp.]HUM91603.1 PilZ domain-containing protein [Candidatus Competibacter sp.]
MTAPLAESEKREFYRLKFPPPERPCLVVGRQKYQVLDCSARGLRFVITQQPTPLLGELVEGWLHFRRNAKAPIRGLVIRIQNGEIALHMPDSEIPFTILRGEERYLLNHYRMWAR